MDFWHMQLHPGEFKTKHVDDIRTILSYNLIGCSGEPVDLFNQVKIGDIVMIRHGGTVVALVQAISIARDVFPEEEDEDIWFDRCIEIKVLQEYDNLKVTGTGWFLPKTLMHVHVDNVIAYNFIYNLYNEIQMQKLIELLQYKKQIILQGPPGTGKTRLAKKIASTLTNQFQLNEKDLSDLLKKGDRLPSVKEKTEYKIETIEDKKVIISGAGIENKNITYEKIKYFFNQNDWDQTITNGDNRGAYALAYFIYKKKSKQVKIIQFHPSYSYEDFVRGIVAKPNPVGEGIIYKAENKTLADFAKEALYSKTTNYVLIIDEINRANLSSVLGELIYALEYRGEKVESMYDVDGDRDLILPPNLYIIGTMNTADRSVGHIDYAIRRRFAFVDVLPKDLSSEMGSDFKTEIFKKVYDLFYDADKKYLSSEFEPDQVCIGHSYFIQQYEKDEDGNPVKEKPIDFNFRLKYEIVPILKEYIKDGVLKDSKELRDIITSLGNSIS